MTSEQIVEELKTIVDEGNKDVLSTKWESAGYMHMVKKGPYEGWRTKTLAFLRLILPDDSEYIKAFADKEKNYYSNAESGVSIINNLVSHIEKGFIIPENGCNNNADADLRRIFSRFHIVTPMVVLTWTASEK